MPPKITDNRFCLRLIFSFLVNCMYVSAFRSYRIEQNEINAITVAPKSRRMDLLPVSSPPLFHRPLALKNIDLAPGLLV